MNSISYNYNNKKYFFYYGDKDIENVSHMTYPPIQLPKKSNIIMDIGGNIGSSAVYFNLIYPDSQIYVFEPDPISYETLIKNTSLFNNISCYNFGLSNENKNIELNRCSYGSSGNSIHLRPEATYEKVPVELKKASDVIKSYNLHNANILKIDTEGCEVEILQSILETDISFDVIYVEYHCDEDRFEIEKLMYPKYNLVFAKINCKNIGELTYINSNINAYEISSVRLPNQRRESK
jgi:FkbM family methyltransferase